MSLNERGRIVAQERTLRTSENSAPLRWLFKTSLTQRGDAKNAEVRRENSGSFR